MTGLLIAIFTGWLGGYRFYKKQFVWGIIYLCTGGLFLVGWLVDIIQAYKAMRSQRKPFSMEIEIKGSFAECKHDPTIKRWAVINGLDVGTELGIEVATYKNAPYLQLVAPCGLDIGSFPAEMSNKIINQYPISGITAKLSEKADPEHPHAQIFFN